MPRIVDLRFTLASLLVTALPAQSWFISPVTAAAAEGTSANGYPFLHPLPLRYQQIHADITQAGSIRAIACRTDGNTGFYAGTRSIDLELYLGLGATGYESMSRYFDANYHGQSKMRVVSRRVVTLGPQGQNTRPGVFTGMRIPFDGPFPYTPGRPLVWEVVQYSNAGSGFFGIEDADESASTPGLTVYTGGGCIASGRTLSMRFENPTMSMFDMGGVLSFSVGVDFAPALAPVALAVGASNPNVRIPGVICGGIYTDLLLTFPVGIADGNGLIVSYQGFSFSAPNTFGGKLTFHAQLHALDPGLSELLKVANSEGRTFTAPAPDMTKVVKVSRLFNMSRTTTDPKGVFFSFASVGYGLVTRFDF